jgi:hypothetical protein
MNMWGEERKHTFLILTPGGGEWLNWCLLEHDRPKSLSGHGGKERNASPAGNHSLVVEPIAFP